MLKIFTDFSFNSVNVDAAVNAEFNKHKTESKGEAVFASVPGKRNT